MVSYNAHYDSVSPFEKVFNESTYSTVDTQVTWWLRQQKLTDVKARLVHDYTLAMSEQIEVGV